MNWSSLPDIPDQLGVAWPFAGVSDGALIVAGGANFPNRFPWEGGTKVWHDQVYALREGEKEWQVIGKLPLPLGYGVSATTKDGIICAGGSDSTTNHRDVFLLQWKDGTLQSSSLAPLPHTCANACGALIGNVLYIAGGEETPGATTAMSSFWSLDTSNPTNAWQELPAIPGPARMLATCAVQEGKFFLIGGVSLSADEQGKPKRTYLNDAYRFDPAKKSWQRIADLPHPVAAAPSPAPAVGQSHFFILGGDDGSKVGFQPINEHPGFSSQMLAYHTVTNTWASLGDSPVSQVTTPTVKWNQHIVIPSGEVRPGVRTPAVHQLDTSFKKSAFGMINWVVVVIYLAAMIAVGVWFMKREAASTTDAYFRGGQRVPSWVAGLSIFATMLSAITFMAIPARAFRTDISWSIGQLTLLIITPIVIAFYLPIFRSLNLTSAYEYLERRFSLACRIFASLSFTAFHLGRIAIVLYLPALALSAVSDIGVMTAIIIIGVLCLIYTVIGGIEAVVWTDAVQAIVLMGGALLCFCLAVFRVDGGVANFAAIATADQKLFESLQWTSFNIADGTTSFIVLFIALFFNSFVPYTSSQDVVQRYITTKDIGAAKKSLNLSMWMSIFAGLLFFLMGTAVYAFYKTHPTRLDPTLPAGDSILPYFIMSELPVGISGLVIAAIFAAAQSTISSSLNSVATTFVKDFDMRLFRPDRDDRTYLRSAQAMVIVAGTVGIVIAIVMAESDIQSAFATFNSMIGLTAGSLGGLFALGVFTRRCNAWGALVGAILGLGTVLTLYLTKAPVSGLLYAAIGFVACFLFGLLASMLLPGGKSAPDGLAIHSLKK